MFSFISQDRLDEEQDNSADRYALAMIKAVKDAGVSEADAKLAADAAGEIGKLAREATDHQPHLALLARAMSVASGANSGRAAMEVFVGHGLPLPDYMFTAVAASRTALQHALAEIDGILALKPKVN